MLQLTEAHFEALRKADAIRRRIRTITPDHVAAFGRYLLFLPLWLFAAFYGAYAIDRAGLDTGGWIWAGLTLLAIVISFLPVLRVRRHLRRPVLDELAQRNSLDYASHDFELRAYNEAKPRLFGEDATETLTDLLAGNEGAKAYAVCHAQIDDKDGKPLFSGLVYSFVRRAKGGLSLVMLPATRTSGDPELPRTMQRAAFASDPAFEAAFEIWANRPAEAQELLDDNLRRTLLDLAGDGPLYLYLDRDDVFIAGGGPKSFESDGTATHRPGERVRAIFDNAGAALRVLDAMRARLG